MEFKNIVLILMVLSITFAVQMLEPVSKDLESGEEIFLGTIGPGQTLELSIDPWIYDSSGEYIAHYDLATAVELPEGWKSQQSKLYGDPLHMTITAPSDEAEGSYQIGIGVLDEDQAEEVEDLVFIGVVKVEYDIMDIDVQPQTITTGANQPAKFYITIMNKGSASDVFEVGSENIPKWSFKKYIYIPPMSSKTIVYEIVETEEETFNPIVNVVSTSSGIIKEKKNLTLEVHTDLMNDYKAVNHGTPIFPILEEVIFAFMGLLSNLW